LGIAVDTTVFDAYRNGSGGTAFSNPDTLVPLGEHRGVLLRILDGIRRQLAHPGSPSQTGLGTAEVEAELLSLLAHACGPEPADGRGLAAEGARRAEEVLAADLRRPLTLAEAAAEVGFSPRTLSRTIEKRHGMGPMAFRRRMRLEAAHRDLRCADPASTTVTEVALRYGFTELGRFAGAHYRTFGELPSECLGR
jgi:AraC-like DNA-binding protein